jgi:hypothetical protein
MGVQKRFDIRAPDIRGVTYNGGGFNFDSPKGDSFSSEKHTQAHKNVSSLIESFDYVGIQEEQIDEDWLQDIPNIEPWLTQQKTRFPGTHAFFNPPTVGDGGGGTSLRFNGRLLKKYTLHPHIVVKGRVQVIEMRPRAGHDTLSPVMVGNVYLMQGSHWGDKTEQIVALHEFLVGFRHTHFIHLMGDFNFVEDLKQDVFTHSHNEAYWRPTEAFSTAWSDLLEDLSLREIHQPVHTHWQKVQGGITSSRLDRHYASVTESDYTTHNIHSWLAVVPNSPLSSNAHKACTDHQPVGVAFLTKGVDVTKKTKVMPDWVFNHCLFPEVFQRNWDRVQQPRTGADQQDQLVRILINSGEEVMRLTRAKPVMRGEHMTSASQLLRALCATNLDYKLIASIVKDEPSLKEFLISGGDYVFDTTALREHINSFFKANGEPEYPILEGWRQEEGIYDDPKPSKKVKHPASILPSSKRRLRSVRGLGEIASTTDPDTIVGVLENYWGDVWKNSGIDRSVNRSRVLSTWGKRLRLKLRMVDLGDIEEAIEAGAAKGSSPGRDGIPFVAYKAVMDTAGPILLQVTKDLQKSNTRLPQFFNEGNIIFSPKEEGRDRVDKLRPIVVGTAAARIVAKAILAACYEAISDILDPSQRGFLKGYLIDDNILACNRRFFESFEGEGEGYLFLLDYRRAFDSVEHEYILAVLKQVGCPTWFLNTITNLLTGVLVFTCIQGAKNTSLKVERGIKQGCPLSPLLFILGLDVFLTTLHQVKRAWADDVAIFMYDLAYDLPDILDKAKVFSSISGLCLNLDKCIIIPTSKPTSDTEALVRQYEVKLLPHGKYLGVLVGGWNQKYGTASSVQNRLWVHHIYAETDDRFNKRTVSYLPYSSSFSISRRIQVANTRLLPLYQYKFRYYTIPQESVVTVKHNLEGWLGGGQGKDYTIDLFKLPHHLLGFRTPLRDVSDAGTAMLASLHVGRGYENAYLQAKSLYTLFIDDHREGAVYLCGNVCGLKGPRDPTCPYRFLEFMGGDTSSNNYSQILYCEESTKGHLDYIAGKWPPALQSEGCKCRKSIPKRKGRRRTEPIRCSGCTSLILRVCYSHFQVHKRLQYMHWIQLQLVLGILLTASRRAGYKGKDPSCRLCRLFAETTGHLYYQCVVVQGALAALVHFKGVHGSIQELQSLEQATLLFPFYCKTRINRTVAVNHAIYMCCLRVGNRTLGIRAATHLLYGMMSENINILPKSYKTDPGLSWGGGAHG